MKTKPMEYPYLILHTGRSDKSDTHWWSILDIHLKNVLLLFDSFKIMALKSFFITDDRITNNKISFELQKLKPPGNKTTVLRINILCAALKI